MKYLTLTSTRQRGDSPTITKIVLALLLRNTLSVCPLCIKVDPESLMMMFGRIGEDSVGVTETGSVRSDGDLVPNWYPRRP